MAMGAREVALVIKVLADVSKAQAGLKQTEGFVGKAGSAIQGMAIPAGIALGAITAVGAGAAGAASDVEQSFGALESVYKADAGNVKIWARNAAKQTGLATADYATMAATIGSQLKNMGVPMGDVAGQTDELIRLGADLSATYGGTTAEAVTALSALLRGERDPIERYGVSIKQAGVDAQVAAMGLDTSTAAAKTNAQTVATLALLTKQTADAQGQFARESDTAAHAQQVASAEWTNAQAALGEALLPAVIAVSKALSAFSKFITENKKLVLILAVVVGGLSAGIIALNIAMKIAQAATIALQAAQWLLNAAMAANPIGLVVLAIVALVAIFVVAYKKSETFRRIVDGVFQAVVSIVRSAVAVISGIFAKLGEVLAGPFRFFQSVVSAVLGAVKAAISGFAKFVNAILAPIKAAIGAIQAGIKKVKDAIDHLPSLPKMPWDNSKAVRGVPVPGGLMAPRVAGLGAVGRTGGASAGPTINVYGALDPEAVARQIRRILSGHAARTGSAIDSTDAI